MNTNAARYLGTILHWKAKISIHSFDRESLIENLAFDPDDLILEATLDKSTPDETTLKFRTKGSYTAAKINVYISHCLNCCGAMINEIKQIDPPAPEVGVVVV